MPVVQKHETGAEVFGIFGLGPEGIRSGAPAHGRLLRRRRLRNAGTVQRLLRQLEGNVKLCQWVK